MVAAWDLARHREAVQQLLATQSSEMRLTAVIINLASHIVKLTMPRGGLCLGACRFIIEGNGFR
jgi:hypothetical protein